MEGAIEGNRKLGNGVAIPNDMVGLERTGLTGLGDRKSQGVLRFSGDVGFCV
jgi:hypothetical protein